MVWTFRALLAAVVVAALTGSAMAQLSKPNKGDPPKDYRWEEEVKWHALTDAELQFLKQHKFVITDQTFKQVFQPYLGGKVPIFITTDSLLNGFHVLFEESVFRMEQANARKLPGILEDLCQNLDRAGKELPGNPQLLKSARQRADIFLGTARHLLDAKALPKDAAVRALVEQEVGRIVAAKELTKPAWLGKPDPGFVAIDYSRFKPRGFYTKTLATQRYFRAVSWLQAIPFRLDKDEELVAFLLMHQALRKPNGDHDWKKEEYWRTYRIFLGTGDDWDLTSADRLPTKIDKGGLAAVREEYQHRAKGLGNSQINDQLRFAPASAGGKPEIGFRFLSAYRLPDSVLFQHTIAAKPKRDFPTGLELCAALGSSVAREHFATAFPNVLEAIDACKPLFTEPSFDGIPEPKDSLYAQYLACLGVLLQRTEPDAPKFMHADAWKIKTCQTALGGWAQMRHTWALQAKQTITFLSSTSLPAGFVEPVPEFYSRLARLVKETHAALNDAGALAAPSASDVAEDMKAIQMIVDKVRKAKKGIDCLTAEEQGVVKSFYLLHSTLEKPEKEREKELAELSQTLGKMHQALAAAKEQPIELPAGLGEWLPGIPPDIKPKWTQLSELSRGLEVLANKQLRQVAFSGEEVFFLKSYGKSLASIMLYGGNSYLDARDDAPRIVDVFTNAGNGKHLLVGIAKTRTLWVLYPVKGVDILCRGAVLPYHEFAHAERLTDSEWRSLLDSPQRPVQPAWLKPIIAPDQNPK